jgi:hypothetical protein
MYFNLDTSQRKVATFRVWGKRPGYPVHRRLDRICKDPGTQWKGGWMGPEGGLQGVTKGKLPIAVWNVKSVVQRAVSLVNELSRLEQNQHTLHPKYVQLP